MSDIKYYLERYLQERPLFLSLIRACEAVLYSSYLPFTSPVLDVGCGDGFFAKLVVGHVDIGLDVSDSRMDEATGLKVYKKLVQYDGKHFPFKNNSFQTIISNCVLEHVSSLDEVVAQMYRVLAPGGTALITVMATPWEEHLFGSLFLGTSYKNYMRAKQIHLNLFSLHQWTKTFADAGFRIEKTKGYLSPRVCRLIDICHYFSIPSLITYTMFGKWVLWPKLVNLYPVSWFATTIGEPVELEKSGALFFVLSK